MHTQDTGNCRVPIQPLKLIRLSVCLAKIHTAVNKGDQHAEVDQIAPRQSECLAAESGGKFAPSDNGASKGDRPNSNGHIGFDLVNEMLDSFGIIALEKLGEAHQHGSQSHKAVQNGHQLRHLIHGHAGSDDRAQHGPQRNRGVNQ